jgi:hypothetical protein
MRALKVFVAAGVAVAATVVGVSAGPAKAANDPILRDCALPLGLDPDFVEITSVAVGPSGSLTVPLSNPRVVLIASESSDPGDSSGADTFHLVVSSPGLATQTLSGTGIGKVTLDVGLARARIGRSYTIRWAATFDGGNHACPSPLTPANTTAGGNPFVVTVRR